MGATYEHESQLLLKSSADVDFLLYSNSVLSVVFVNGD